VDEKTLVLKRIAGLRACKSLQKISANQLLGNRRAALGKRHPGLPGVLAVWSSAAEKQRTKVCLAEQSREDRIVHARMREKVLIFGRKDGLAQDLRDILILDDFPAFPC